MVRFESKTIKEITQALIDYRGKTPPKVKQGIRLITAKVVKEGTIKDDRAEFISEETYKSWMRRGYPKQHDILITTEAPLGEVAQLRTNEPIALAQRIILLRGNPEIVNQGYLFQALQSPFVQAGLHQRATGTTVLGIKQSELIQVQVPLPPLPTQRKIAAILSAYDDLIENNTRRIKILENMAQSLYQEWFVKFRFPGYEQVAFVDSPLGKIPEGWEIGIVNDLLVLSSGFAFRSNTFSEDGTYGLVTIKNVHDGMFIPNCTSRISEPPENMPRYCYLSTGDILISLTGNIGRVCIVYGNDYLLNQRVAKLVPREQKNWAYIYCSFRHIDFQNRLCTIANGVAQQNLSPVATGNMQIAIPSKALLDSFSTISEPLIESIVKLFRINSILRETRDLLLPKLISGELDVSNLDISMPEEMSA